MTSGLKIALILASAAVVASSSVAQVNRGGKRYVVQMTGEAEVTPQGAPNQGDLDGTGTAIIVVNKGQNRVCWDIDVANVAPLTLAHIHLGFVGQAFAGNIIVNLGTGSGCTTTAIPQRVMDALLLSPQVFYVNVHNGPFPAGALRGQLG